MTEATGLLSNRGLRYLIPPELQQVTMPIRIT